MLYRLQGVRVRLGGEQILDGVDFQHNPGEHLVLVGRNGAGKTTLLRLLAGEVEPELGRVQTVRSLSLARLNQHFEAPSGSTVLSYAMAAYARIAALERDLDGVAEELTARPGDGELLERLSELQDALEAHDPYRAEAEALTSLAAFGLGGELAQRPVGELSGGQRTRLALVRALLEPADLLLLDEPTNHLDLLGAQALIRLLEQRRGAVLVATHDRELIDRVGTAVVEVEGGRLRRWPGGYERYRRAKAEEREAQQRAWQRQQEHIARAEDYIRRNIAGQRTKQAQARRKELDRLEPIERPVGEGRATGFAWGEVPRAGDVVVAAEGVAAGYDGPVVRGVKLVIRRGERVAVVGANGAGKTTLLRVLAGRMPPLAGRVIAGHGVAAAWYDQELADLPLEGTVLDVLWSVHPTWSPTQARSWAARFGFSGEAADRPLDGLSGGERGRVSLARILASHPNMLFLDEPTNHLDLPTCESLEAALTRYPGSLVMVSHDRRLVERVATRVLVVVGGRVREVRSVAEALGEVEAAPVDRGREPNSGGSRRSPLAEEERRLRRDVERLQTETGELEAEIERRHGLIEEANESLADRAAWADPERVCALQDDLEAAREGLDDLNERWAEAAADLEALESRLAEVREELGRG